MLIENLARRLLDLNENLQEHMELLDATAKDAGAIPVLDDIYNDIRAFRRLFSRYRRMRLVEDFGDLPGADDEEVRAPVRLEHGRGVNHERQRRDVELARLEREQRRLEEGGEADE